MENNVLVFVKQKITLFGQVVHENVQTVYLRIWYVDIKKIHNH